VLSDNAKGFVQDLQQFVAGARRKGAIDRSAEADIGSWGELLAQKQDPGAQSTVPGLVVQAEDGVPEDPDHIVQILDRLLDPASH